MSVDVALALASAIAATLFAADLTRDFIKNRRPHVAAYACGMAMFATASWALWAGLMFGWTGAGYRVFFLFGAILNITTLAVGSMFLVIGPKAGNTMTLFTGALAAISSTLVTTVPFAEPLPESGVPDRVFAPLTEGFGPRMLAAIGSGLGASILILLALISVFRFWKSNRRIVAGNLLIMLGVLAGSTGGTLLGFLGETAAFETTLLVTVVLIWLGYRVTRRKPKSKITTVRLLLVGPTTNPTHRQKALLLLQALESAGFEVTCPPRDIEDWGAIGFSPAETMYRVFQQVESSTLVVADMTEGEDSEVVAGYARAIRVPVVATAPEGKRIPRALRAVAGDEIYYASVAELVTRLRRFLAPAEE
jgi:hypothetical protein